jgi:hypothetical protein
LNRRGSSVQKFDFVLRKFNLYLQSSLAFLA